MSTVLASKRTLQVVTVSSALAFVTYRLLHSSATKEMPVPSAGVINDQAYIKGMTQQQVFDYLANFENIASWDPGCVEAKRVDSGPVKVGSAFDLVTVFKGSKSDMRYKVTKLNSPNEVVLDGESSAVKVTDTIKVMPSPTDPNQVQVDYTADLTLKGWKRPLIVFLKSDLNKLGRAAVEGLEKALNPSS